MIRLLISAIPLGTQRQRRGFVPGRGESPRQAYTRTPKAGDLTVIDRHVSQP
jgi:hypothetical protein